MNEHADPSRDGKRPILLGLNLANGAPIHLERDFLSSGHLHIRGRTGAGKTSRAVLPLILQLLATDTGHSAPEPIFIFDLGGDRALFHCVREACQQAGRVFRFLSLNPDDDWHYFDPFQAASQRTERVIDLAEMLIEAFSLEYGPIYGGLYFTQQNLRALLRVAQHLAKRKAAAREITIDDIAKILERNDRRIRDAEQIRATFEFLCEYRQLKPHLAPSKDQVIDLHVNGARIVQRLSGSRRSAEKCSAHGPACGFVTKTCDGKSVTSPTNRENHECTKTCISGLKSAAWC